MTETEIRLACLEYAIEGNTQREAPIARAPKLAEWVNGNPIRLACLRLAFKASGKIAKITSDALISEAEKYLEFVGLEPEIKTVKRTYSKKKETKKDS